MHIALATCSSLPDGEIDDAPFHQALARRGVTAPQVVWDDPEADWSQYDAVLTRYTWDYMEKHAAFVAWAMHVEHVTRLFNSAAVVAWNTNKSYLRDLEASGVSIAPTIWLEQGQSVEVAQLMTERNWQRGFIKPLIGATARETLRFNADESGLAEARAHLQRTLANENMMLQPYLNKVETEGEISAIFIDGEVSHCVRKIPRPGDYRVQDNFGASDELYVFSEEELEQARQAHRAAGGDLLYARADFLRDDSGGLVLTEFEAVEPSLFFRHDPEAGERLADALCARVASAI